MRESFIQTKNGKIWYSAYGEDKEGEPLLVLHGGPGFSSLPETVSKLSNKRPVYFYDQIGCGRSDRAKDKSFYSIANYVNELAEVRERLGLQEVYLMGFSWGTMLACSYMLEKKPGGIKGLILSGPYLSSSRWQADQRENIRCMPSDIMNIIMEAERIGDYGEKYQAAVELYYKKHVCCLDPWPVFLKEAFSNLNMDVYLTMWGPSEFTITGTLKDRDITDQLKKINEPVLLICGEHDEASVKTVKAYRAAFSNAGMVVLPGASHMHYLEKPTLFLEVVRKFLKD